MMTYVSAFFTIKGSSERSKQAQPHNIRDKPRVRSDLCLSADDQSEHLPVWRQYPSTNDENQNDGVSEKLCWNLVKLPSVNSIHLPLSRLLGVKRSYYRVLV